MFGTWPRVGTSIVIIQLLGIVHSNPTRATESCAFLPDPRQTVVQEARSKTRAPLQELRFFDITTGSAT
jgi:hypothetical protein